MKKEYAVVLGVLLIGSFFLNSSAIKEEPKVSTVFYYFASTQFSPYTDPGEFADLYKPLPESLDELCDLVKKQLIHPFDLGKYADVIPKNRVYEDRELPTVSLMLKELLKRNKNGLVASRKPEERLVVACVHHSMLLASILRFRGIPVRIRAGHAK